MDTLISEYRKKKRHIKKRLRDFSYMQKAGDEDIFEELCFCILTPQTKAVNCDRAVKDLKRTGLLCKGSEVSIGKRLKGLVRFHNNKAGYIVAARKLFKNGKGLEIKCRFDKDDISGTRDWLVGNVKGLGYKEASHFLRNIGLGEDIAIIDRHIMKNLKRHGVIKKIPASIGRKRYLEIEETMKKFSKKTNIPIGELDLLFWSRQTGFILK